MYGYHWTLQINKINNSFVVQTQLLMKWTIEHVTECSIVCSYFTSIHKYFKQHTHREKKREKEREREREREGERGIGGGYRHWERKRGYNEKEWKYEININRHLITETLLF